MTEAADTRVWQRHRRRLRPDISRRIRTSLVLLSLAVALAHFTEITAEEDTRPSTLEEASSYLDQQIDPAEIKKVKAGGACILSSDKAIGMQLRNKWGLGTISPLTKSFAERKIEHADWAYAAICEAWVERLRTGSCDEERLIRKYAEIEAKWRASMKQLEMGTE